MAVPGWTIGNNSYFDEGAITEPIEEISAAITSLRRNVIAAKTGGLDSGASHDYVFTRSASQGRFPVLVIASHAGSTTGVAVYNPNVGSATTTLTVLTPTMVYGSFTDKVAFGVAATETTNKYRFKIENTASSIGMNYIIISGGDIVFD